MGNVLCKQCTLVTFLVLFMSQLQLWYYLPNIAVFIMPFFAFCLTSNMMHDAYDHIASECASSTIQITMLCDINLSKSGQNLVRLSQS